MTSIAPTPVTPDPLARRRGWSLRTRLVVLATLGLAVGLAVGGAVLTIVLQLGLERASDAAARQTGQDVVQLIEELRSIAAASDERVFELTEEPFATRPFGVSTPAVSGVEVPAMPTAPGNRTAGDGGVLAQVNEWWLRRRQSSR